MRLNDTVTKQDRIRKEMADSPHVHVYTGYLQGLKSHWAYVGTQRIPGRKNE